MKDRSVEYPNRYRMTLVPGTTDIYEMTPVPGEVYEEGTLMSKGNILDDNSEMDIWGTIGDRTPNDAFSFIGKSLSEHDEDIANLAATLEGKIVTGIYTATGSEKTVNLGFRPKAVLVVSYNKSIPSGTNGFAVDGVKFCGGNYGDITITNTGFNTTTGTYASSFSGDGNLIGYMAFM